MARPIIYTREDMEALISDKVEKGIPIKTNCRTKAWPYVSVNKAIRKYGLSIPRTYAQAKAKAAGKPVEPSPVPKAKKTRQLKAKAPEPSQMANPTV